MSPVLQTPCRDEATDVRVDGKLAFPFENPHARRRSYASQIFPEPRVAQRFPALKRIQQGERLRCCPRILCQRGLIDIRTPIIKPTSELYTHSLAPRLYRDSDLASSLLV